MEQQQLPCRGRQAWLVGINTAGRSKVAANLASICQVVPQHATTKKAIATVAAVAVAIVVAARIQGQLAKHIGAKHGRVLPQHKHTWPEVHQQSPAAYGGQVREAEVGNKEGRWWVNKVIQLQSLLWARSAGCALLCCVPHAGCLRKVEHDTGDCGH